MCACAQTHTSVAAYCSAPRPCSPESAPHVVGQNACSSFLLLLLPLHHHLLLLLLLTLLNTTTTTTTPTPTFCSPSSRWCSLFFLIDSASQEFMRTFGAWSPVRMRMQPGTWWLHRRVELRSEAKRGAPHERTPSEQLSRGFQLTEPKEGTDSLRNMPTAESIISVL
jgi:hypothetical protein